VAVAALVAAVFVKEVPLKGAGPQKGDEASGGAASVPPTMVEV
jgi:hypothetical protein